MSELSPIHHSFKYGKSGRPRNMTRAYLDHEQTATLRKVALDIFADMSNANWGFQDALMAIYLSGLNHGQEITKEARP